MKKKIKEDKKRLRKQKIREKNQQFEKFLIILFGLLLILFILLTNNFEGLEKITRCKNKNHGEWCNNYKLEKMED